MDGPYKLKRVRKTSRLPQTSIIKPQIRSPPKRIFIDLRNSRLNVTASSKLVTNSDLFTFNGKQLLIALVI